MPRHDDLSSLTIRAASTGEVRLSAEPLSPEERRWGVYRRGLTPKQARKRAAELLRAADEAEEYDRQYGRPLDRHDNP